MSYACLFQETHYGTSGTELPPPVANRISYVILSRPEEHAEDFKERMNSRGLEERANLEKLPVSSYSQRPGIDWQIVEVKE
jgi:hypothetical protein